MVALSCCVGLSAASSWALTFSPSCQASDARSSSSQLARLLLQDTENSVKNHWHNTMKKKVNPTTVTDPVLKALAAYQAHQDSMNPINSVDQLESSVSMVGKVGLLTNKATTSSEQPM
ncbi:unnamed protein product [Sphagnum jensenii]|uniref:Uncharacterized protein n=1 Tax=Sphagnum jensenii TaxID=128206 RepID=A0ABP1A593_9BRYO